MRILLGGIPLGCDNIGDEAIIAGVVKMLKEAIPDVRLSVATADASTAALLGVEVVPPYGFAGQGIDGFADVASKHDAYIWCGATGLSDYPNVALDLLESAQSRNVPTFIWGVGMDTELNPVFFKAHGRKRWLLSKFGLVDWYEDLLRRRLSKRFVSVLPKCKGIWLRDPESVEMLASMGYEGAGVTADTAIVLRHDSIAESNHRSGHTLGICISAQRQVSDMDGLKGFLDTIRAAGIDLLGIPMNPKTDRPIMEQLGVNCIDGKTPDDVMAAAAQCDAVLSSRLHLLILAANVGTLGLGIARGSKLDNWLANFGMKTVGSVHDCDWNAIAPKVISAVLTPDVKWSSTRKNAFLKLERRFDAARDELTLLLRE
ncbi:MAG: polysaccharide pyruvyl transferase family protein [Victivallales bacterium]|nr:polysaccharide pyruvyl transferase family protein [Victivallales bacterium]